MRRPATRNSKHATITCMPELTTDTIFNGHVRVRQPRDGYRYSTDTVLLACHLHPRPGDTVVDLGTGCGIIPLILAYRHPEIKIIGVEVQPELAEIAAANVADNSMADRINIICTDMKDFGRTGPGAAADVVVSNPPYRKTNAGRINPNRQRAIAKHEIKATLSDLMAAARRILRSGGKFISIYTADRMTELIVLMRSLKIEPKVFRMIHADLKAEAKMMLIEGIKDGRPGSKIAPPLIVHRQDGSYTREVQEMFQP